MIPDVLKNPNITNPSIPWQRYEEKMNECYENGDQEKAEEYKSIYLALYRADQQVKQIKDLKQRIDNVEIHEDNIKKWVNERLSYLESRCVKSIREQDKKINKYKDLYDDFETIKKKHNSQIGYLKGQVNKLNNKKTGLEKFWQWIKPKFI